MTIDTVGRTYVATSLGVQVLDQPGRVNFIIRKPQPGALANVVLGGPERNVLYATCGDSVYKRRINAIGVDLRKQPVNVPKPRL
jgi:gluconolactonase